MAVTDEMLEQLLDGVDSSKDLWGKDGLLKNLSGRLIEKMLESELSDHLGYEKHSRDGFNSGNSRNGHSKKNLKSGHGEIPIRVPRDRNSSFEPVAVAKGERVSDELAEKILYFYSTGQTTRDIQAQLKDIYGADVSPTLISKITDEVMDEVITWKNRPLESLYPIVYMDALVVKVREDKSVIKKAVYLALGVNLEGKKEILGMWCSQNEGSKFWLQCLTELKNRGVQDILIACVDGLSGFPEAIEAVFPQTDIQLCIVHMVRNSLKYVSYKDRKEVATDLKQIYRATTEEEAIQALDLFSEKWDKKYASISKSWYQKWDNLNLLFNFPEEIRKVIYTTNAIESVNMGIRKVIKNKRVFPTEDSMFKMVYLAIQRLTKKWTMALRDWKAALNQLAIRYDGRKIGRAHV